jgi:hypothetical protein
MSNIFNGATMSNIIDAFKTYPSTATEAITFTASAHPTATIFTINAILIGGVLVHRYTRTAPIPNEAIPAAAQQVLEKKRPTPIITPACALLATGIAKISPTKINPEEQIVDTAPEALGAMAPGPNNPELHEMVAVEKVRVPVEQAPALSAGKELGEEKASWWYAGNMGFLKSKQRVQNLLAEGNAVEREEEVKEVGREDDGTCKLVEREGDEWANDVFGVKQAVESAEDSPDFVREGEGLSGYGGESVKKGGGQVEEDGEKVE